jgi:hypothetical protein
MKKWMYLISVGSMLAVFLFFYFAHLKETEQREKEHAALLQKKLAEEAKHKAELEEKARLDAAAKSAARAAEEAKKEADRVAKWEAAGLDIKNTTDTLNAESDKLSKEAAALEIQLSNLRDTKEKLNRETFELAKRVELAKINKQNAEMGIQRTTEMIARRATASSLTQLPPPLPAPAKS